MPRLNAASWLLPAVLARAVLAQGGGWAAAKAAHPPDEPRLEWADSSPQTCVCDLNAGCDDRNYASWHLAGVLPQDQIRPQSALQASPAAAPPPPDQESGSTGPTPAPTAPDQPIDPQVIEQARGGDAVAQYKLGYDYYLGHGIAQDYVQAAIWWKKAAEQGYPRAQNNLGALYNSGKGVPQSYSEAYFWQNLAAARANSPLQAQFAKNRDDSAAKLSMWEKMRVQKRASKWAAEHPVTPKPADEPEGNP